MTDTKSKHLCPQCGLDTDAHKECTPGWVTPLAFLLLLLAFLGGVVIGGTGDQTVIERQKALLLQYELSNQGYIYQNGRIRHDNDNWYKYCTDHPEEVCKTKK